MAQMWKKNNPGYFLAALIVLAIALGGAWRYFGTGGGLAQRAETAAGTAAPHFILRFGLNLSADSALHAGAVRFAEQIAQRSKGRIEVKVYPDQALGTDEQMVEMARDGEVDLLLTPTAKLSADVPAMQYADLPFYFADRAELYAMLDGEPGKLLLAKLNDIGLVGITFWENGFKQFTANRPLRSPEDFAGLRIRTMKSRLIMDQFSIMGAEPVVIDFATLRQALADGAVDGQENPLVAIVGKGLHEVQKHMTLGNHAWLGYVFSASKKTFEHLPQDLRDLIIDTARELAPWEREETARREAKFLETIRAAGVEIHTLSEAERRRFADALAPIARRYGFEVGYDLLAKTDELRALALLNEAGRAGGGLPLPLLIGLDADLSSSGTLAGGAILRGMDMAVSEINAKGGVLGRQLRIMARDHRSNSQRGIENLDAFTQLPGLTAVMGGMHTGVVMDELESIHRLQIPYLIPWSAGTGVIQHDHNPSYTFRLSVDDAWVGPFLLENALRRGQHVAILLEHSAWGRSNEAALKPHIAKLPPGTVTVVWVNRGEGNFDAVLADLAAKGVDVLIMVAIAAESQALIEAMSRRDNPIPIYAHWGFTGGDFWRQTQTALKKVDLRFVQSVLVENGSASPQLVAFARRYRTRYGLAPSDPIPAPAGTAHAYDLTHLLARAILQAGTSDRAAIRDALEHLKKPYSGIIRLYSPPFTPARHDALSRETLRLARYDERGRIVGVR